MDCHKLEDNIMTIDNTNQISSDMVGGHRSDLSFYAHPDGDHILTICMDNYLNMQIDLSDEAIDAIVQMRGAMRARVAEIDSRAV